MSQCHHHQGSKRVLVPGLVHMYCTNAFGTKRRMHQRFANESTFRCTRSFRHKRSNFPSSSRIVAERHRVGTGFRCDGVKSETFSDEWHVRVYSHAARSSSRSSLFEEDRLTTADSGQRSRRIGHLSRVFPPRDVLSSLSPLG